MSSVRLSALRGLTAAEVGKLEKLGLKSTSALMQAAPNTRKERELAAKTGISHARIREAVNRANLVQVKGVGPATADLMENAGVNSARELAHRNPAALAETLAGYVDSHRELNYRAPDAKTVAVLVERAKALYGPETPSVTTLDAARPFAAQMLADYVNDVLFTNHPVGASFRREVLDNYPKADWPKVKAQLLAEIPAYVGTGPSPLNNSGLDSADEDAKGFQLTGRFFGLYTEVKVLKPDGKPGPLLVEVD
ncbi:MAG: DUF4332 domain-containing protein [Archangiaceae bacterium]|nr:DUF4332 domain-containing protein [Archangiaceae bacterium]